MNPRICADDNPKIVKRIFQWDLKQIEISLCSQHCKDPDFAHFISEEKI